MKEFLNDIKQELKRITWPTDKEMKLHTIQVFVFMVFLSLFFAGVDAIISAGIALTTGSPEPTVIEIEDYDANFDYDIEIDAEEEI